MLRDDELTEKRRIPWISTVTHCREQSSINMLSSIQVSPALLTTDSTLTTFHSSALHPGWQGYDPISEAHTIQPEEDFYSTIASHPRHQP